MLTSPFPPEWTVDDLITEEQLASREHNLGLPSGFLADLLKQAEKRRIERGKELLLHSVGRAAWLTNY